VDGAKITKLFSNMPIPDFQTLMLPYLQFMGDGKPHNTAEAEDYLAGIFKVTDIQRQELIPSSRAYRFRNRIAWAIAHFKQAKLIEPISRGIYNITDRGSQVLATGPSRVDLKLLKQFPEYQAWRKKPSVAEEVSREEHSIQTPQEIIDSSFQSIDSALADELLEKIRSSTPAFFEQLVLDLLVVMGYGGSRAEASTRVGRSGDGGIDGIIKEDKLGLDAIYIQAKRWEATVGPATVREFAGSLDGVRARKGVLITTSSFSKDAVDYVTRIDKKIVLIDGEELARLMIEHNVGVAEFQRYVIKRVDLDYFSEE
jgi:restriction system protein